MSKNNMFCDYIFESEMEKKKLTNENIILMFWVKFPIKTIPIQSCHKLQINRKYCLHPLTTEPRRLLTIHMQKFKGFFQIASIYYYDTMNSMQYSKICENINFFLILSLDIGFYLFFFGSFICILTYNGGQNVQTFQKIHPLVMTSV